MKDENNVSNREDAPNLARTGNNNVGLDLRAELGHELRQILIQKSLRQRELAKLLDIQQPEVSHIFNGHFSRFTIDKLIQLLNRLGWTVKFQIHPRETE